MRPGRIVKKGDCGSAISLELIVTPERLLRVAPAWDALWSRARASTFQSHGWISAWWIHLGKTRSQLRVAVAWQGEAAVAILPLVIERRLGVRRLVWAGEAVSDYCDALAFDWPGRSDAIALLWKRVEDEGAFDLIDLKQVRAGANFAPLLGRISANQRTHRVPARHEVTLQVANSWPNGHAYFRSLSKKARNNHTRGKRILSESGQLVFRRVRPEESRTVLDRLFLLKQQWVAEISTTWPMLSGGPAGLRALGDAAAQIDRAAIFVLEVDGSIVAGSFNLIDGSTMRAFMATYDPAFERASPGTILMVEYAMWAFDAEFQEIDYLRGEEPYKLKFANASTHLSACLVAQSTRGKLYLALRAQKTRIRAHLARVRTFGLAGNRPLAATDQPDEAG